MLYGIVLWGHAAAMLGALVLFVVCEFLLMLTRPTQTLSAKLALAARNVAEPLAGAGVLAGIGLVYIGGWPLFTPWLLASFAMIAMLMVIGRTFVQPWQIEFSSAIKEVDGDHINAFARDRAALVGRAIMIALFAAVAGLMAVKPDFGLVL